MLLRFSARCGLLALPLLAGACYSTSDLTPEPAAADELASPEMAFLTDTTHQAWTACRGFAASRLRDPQSAQWPDFESSDVHVQRISGQAGRFGIISAVTAADSRGRMTRQTVVCLLDWRPEQGRWEAVTVTSKHGGMDDPGTPLSLP